MSITSNVKRFIREETHWPNKKVIIAECLGSDNKIYEAFFTPEEKELIMFFITHKIERADALKKLIEDYGQEKWEEGSDDNQMSHDEAV